MKTKAKRSLIQTLKGNFCAFCAKDESAKDICGELRSSTNVTMHYFCALFSSGLGQRGDSESSGLWGFIESDVIREVLRARRLRCKYCGEHGASIGCIVKSCRASFHFWCGVQHGVLAQYFGTFRCYCAQHRLRQVLPPDARKKSIMQPTCAICLTDVDSLVPTDSLLLMPCCQNQLLHRTCLQRQAINSGIHFFKCPLCNNKELFQSQMLKFGIYIPDQDATWELENNAYSDLLERHSRCDVENCECPDGRDVNQLDTCWEIMLCDFCGSNGTHLACSNLKTPMDDWNCVQCQLALQPLLEASSNSGGTQASSPNKRARMDFVSSSSEDRSEVNSRMSSPVRPSSSTSSFEPPTHRLRLSRYVQMRSSDSPRISTGPVPRWLHRLLNDDVHTGRNMGVKLAYLCKEKEAAAGSQVSDVHDSK